MSEAWQLVAWIGLMFGLGLIEMRLREIRDALNGKTTLDNRNKER